MIGSHTVWGLTWLTRIMGDCTVSIHQVSVDIRTPVSGAVIKYVVDKGQTVKIGDPLAHIATGQAGAPAKPAPAAEPEK